MHSILFKEHHKICIAYSVYIFSFKSMKEGHDLRIVVPIKGNIAADIGISKTLDEPDFTIES